MAELTWNGKYDSNGKKTAPVRLALPFQTIETVNESAQQRQMSLDLFAQGQTPEWRNRLIWGDKKYVLPALLPEFAGKVDLIYIDPPFNTGSDFSFTATIPDPPSVPPHAGGHRGIDSLTFTKEPSMIEQKAYRDTWGRGLDGYLQWFHETAALLHELLAETGSLYVHLDYHIGHYAKAVLDEVFGRDNFINEIVWKRSLPHNDPKRYGAIHDIVLFYTKTENYHFNQSYTAQSEEYQKSHYTQVDEDGRIYQLTSLAASGPGPARMFNGRLLEPPKGNHWRYSQDKIDQLFAAGRIIFTKTGMPRYKRYLDESKGSALQSIWTDLNPVNSQAIERLDYATQKPEALLERIIKASSNEGDLVLDCFCGSGTTVAVAEKLGRRWITCDLGRFAIHTTRKRLLNIPNVRPFVVQNLGKYERQAWQAAEFGPHPVASRHPSPAGRGAGGEGHAGGEGLARAIAAQQRYRRFILDLYHAEPLEGYTWLHGVKNGHFVHVGSVDAPIVQSDLTAIAREFWQAVGKNTGATVNTVDILGWDFAFETNETGKQLLHDAGIKAAFKKIPREVLERRAVEQGDIQFFELAALDVVVHGPHPGSQARHPSPVATGEGPGVRAVRVELRDFVVHPDDVPQDIMSKITHWSQWIDYWAIDWDFKGDTFHNEWQAYRTRQSPTLQTCMTHSYEQPGTYTIVVKVIDILGNDTTRSVTVEVG